MHQVVYIPTNTLITQVVAVCLIRKQSAPRLNQLEHWITLSDTVESGQSTEMVESMCETLLWLFGTPDVLQWKSDFVHEIPKNGCVSVAMTSFG